MRGRSASSSRARVSTGEPQSRSARTPADRVDECLRAQPGEVLDVLAAESQSDVAVRVDQAGQQPAVPDDGLGARHRLEGEPARRGPRRRGARPRAARHPTGAAPAGSSTRPLVPGLVEAQLGQIGQLLARRERRHATGQATAREAAAEAAGQSARRAAGRAHPSAAGPDRRPSCPCPSCPCRGRPAAASPGRAASSTSGPCRACPCCRPSGSSSSGPARTARAAG